MAKTYPIGVVRAAGILQNADLNPRTTTSGSDGSNNWLFEILKNATTVMASKATNTAELAAGTAYALTLSGTLANRKVAAGDTLELRITETGNPTDITGDALGGSCRFTKSFG